MSADEKSTITISLCMIVKNEENTLARCLDSIADIVEEIIMIDTGSTDLTLEVAARYTEHICSIPWTDDFAAARNESFSRATQDYILWLDADDVLLERDRVLLRTLKEQLASNIDAVIMDYHLAEDEAGRATFASRRTRLVKRDRGYRWYGCIHEDLDIGRGKVIFTDIAITHRRSESDHTERNHHIMTKWLTEEEPLEGRMLYHYANECCDRQEYPEAITAFEKLLSESAGYREDRIGACLRLSQCYDQLGDMENKLHSLFRSFRYDRPQSDICCAIGECFMTWKEWHTAIYWYEQSVEQQIHRHGLRLVSLICYTWLPHIRLSYCYASIGDIKRSYEYNEKALKYLPEDIALLSNRTKLKKALGL